MSENSLKKCVPIEIPDDNPFQNDVLRRKDNIEILTKFITSFEQSIVLCIDGGWGQGKTTFIRMWEKYLHQHSIPTIYFNAWESDYTDDALIALIGEINIAVEKLPEKEQKKVKIFIEKIYGFAANFIKATAPTLANLAIKALSSGLTNADEVTKALSSLSESLVKEQINQYEQSRKTLGNFKEALSELARSYANGNQDTPLVIFIDELDRCRPNYAIEVLEKAKHLFNVDNIIFVLATDKSQLAHSIRAVYGQGLDVNGYLRRFIDFDYLLPTSNNSNFFKILLQKFSLEQFINNKGPFYNIQLPKYTYLNFINDLISLYQLTLREQEAFCNILNIVVRTHNRFEREEFAMLFSLIIIKLKVPDIYKSLNKDNINNFIYSVLENLHLHYPLVNSNNLYFFTSLECMLLNTLSSNCLNLDAIIVQDYIKKYNYDKRKINVLKECFDKLESYPITTDKILDIKAAIEISMKFSL